MNQEIEKAKAILKKHGYIMHLWHKDDIIFQAEIMEVELTESEFEQVYYKLEDIDANIGINWNSIEMTINEVKQL